MGVLFRRIGGIVHGDGVLSLKGLALRHHVTPHLRAGLLLASLARLLRRVVMDPAVAVI
jgi:hypothetical protein